MLAGRGHGMADRRAHRPGAQGERGTANGKAAWAWDGRSLAGTDGKRGGIRMGKNSVHGGAALPEEAERRTDGTMLDGLIRDQAVCDVLEPGMLMQWYARQRVQHAGKTLIFLSRAVQDCADMLALGTIPEGLDCEHTVFQALVDEHSGSVLQCRLIRFAEMAPEVERSLRDRTYIIAR